MKPKLAIFLSFIIFSLSMVGYSFYHSTMLKLTRTEAGGFGISPPYFTVDEIRPGESYGNSITLLRSTDENDQLVSARVDAPDIKNWLNIKSGDKFTIKDGSFRTNVAITVNIPEFTSAGDYNGRIYFYTSKSGSDPGVKVSLGAVADINISVISPGSEFLSDLIVADQELYSKLKGNFITVSGAGNRLYYANPDEQKITLIASSAAAMLFISNLATGISNNDIIKIPPDLDYLVGLDSDQDGLPDNFEAAIGTDSLNTDSDGDKFPDLMELENGFNPLVANAALPIELEFARDHAGHIFLQIENEGQAWYVNPINNRRYFLPDYESAWFIFMQIAKNIEVTDFNRLIVK